MARNYKRLVYKDRQEIERMCNDGKSPKEIAAAIGIHIATIYRELERGTVAGENKYSADIAQRAIG